MTTFYELCQSAPVSKIKHVIFKFKVDLESGLSGACLGKNVSVVKLLLVLYPIHDLFCIIKYIYFYNLLKNYKFF